MEQEQDGFAGVIASDCHPLLDATDLKIACLFYSLRRYGNGNAGAKGGPTRHGTSDQAH
jgi:hypothetical protein